MNNVINSIKKNKGIVLAICAVIIIGIIIGIILIPKDKKDKKEEVSSVEKIKLKEISDSIIDCFEDIEDNDSDGLDKYIVYSLERNYKKNEKTSMTTDEMAKELNSIFSKEIKSEDLDNTGISPMMLEKNIVYDFNAKEFTIHTSTKKMSEIAETKIYKYDLNETYKENGKYVVTYNKLVVSNPYQILNYYNDMNNKASQPEVDSETGEITKEASGEKVDTKEISDYLRGNASMDTIRKYITSDNIKEIGENKGTVKVTFVEQNDKLLIESIS